MKQKLSLQQKMLQKLSPQQIQVIKLLEIPALQLEQRIKKELEENPVLEVEEDSHYGEEEVETPELRSEEDKDNEEFSVEDYMPEDEIPGYRLQTNNYSPDDRQVDIPFSVGDTFHEYLQQQAEMENFSDRELQLAKYILGNIDEDGYLRRDLLSISDDLAFHLNMDVQEEELEKILRVIQGFDPPGVGARNLQESLLLQLERRNSEHRILATTIIRDHFEEFTRRHYDKITRRLNVDDEELKQAIDLILKLNPKPGSSYSNPHNKSNQHIVPDFILEVIDGELQLSLNQRNMPELRINESYLDMLRSLAGPKSNGSRNNREAASFVRQKLDSAKWFIDAIRQRQHTLLATMSEIIDFQKEYFQDGDETRLKPMILKDIAERTGLDISTVSRVSNSKYIQTHFGIYPLKFFFSEAMQKDTGEEVSSREIKKILRDVIDNEDKRHPVTDEKLTEILKEKSYNIARRTVAKYREQLDIPVARLRKEL
ncbi:MAG: RNA polymerase factor sigma-54 [Prolixibacteraceae bacterium]|jgi:RNA polymerase sigma-54 factor|nr:RNA polymerase factor sigma-54 [Bacteroidota bacterium]NLS99756.1 RNA polymerase factor sigma-54 [Bacteroidales bacterium]HNZ67820.1 RNA polymerase factor sigma-54 [Prolixibacteraceae bacterium]HOG94796.1 RNA polymerase factor sigma-54 [Prolixibacteraceae bacterium]HPI33905.1 RNA polymerase factor sigma-54 [Prolixibacteraceae bacterium]